ncbi:NACHT N-terminal Helical domain 1-containing protein [Amycolatopsis sp. MEPSY49]|uniref:NACHT N-terminal Helical domain 1-containing protein n=1 Tax=Amycolatopsis sp. MEPSY49 TaxID=3151600 RepID=UPI003EF49B7D
MSIETTALLKIGGAVAKAAGTAWLRTKKTDAERKLTLTELVGARGLGVIPQRRLGRQFDQLAETVAERLQPLVEAEFRGLPDNERLAALTGVARALEAADLSDARVLGAAVSSSSVERLVDPAATAVLAGLGLSESAERFFALVLRESVAYLTEVISTLPSFQHRALRELLERDNEIIDHLREILDRMPERGPASSTDSAAEFELEYRREIARKLDQVELFGVTASRPTRRYPLSVAYIGLMASTNQDDESVDATLSGSPRTLIRGEAGSGKTTLLRWLAVKCAQSSLESSLAPWNGLVPFFVQLRRFAGRQLPTPGELLTAVGWQLRDHMPPRFAWDILMSGRGLVLVDGVDEVPEHEREAVREWLSDLVGAFPNSRYVITSRPPAVPDGWLDDEGFTATELLPMSSAHIREFAKHWHDAIRLNSPTADHSELGTYEGALLASIDANPALRTLATNPLLCALICALNHDRHAQLPRGRMELYRTALDMLLNRRDTERRILDEADLSQAEKQLLLEDLAHWYTLNQLTNADVGRVVNRLGARLAQLPAGNRDPEKVYSRLLLRSGLLREFSAGQVDFAHKTFQEYLAAKRIVETDSIEMLARHAADDSYREVIVMAVGHARPREQDYLIGRILDAAGERPELRFLAIACMETATQLSRDVHDRLLACLREVIPPQSYTEARVLAMVGEQLLPLLRTSRLTVAAARATVRAAALVAGRRALPVLAALARQAGPTVVRELVRSWTYFDPEAFAEEVMAHAPLPNGTLRIADPAVLPGVRHLPRLQDLVCEFSEPLRPAHQEILRATPALRNLRVANDHELKSLSFLHGHPRVRTVSLRNVSNLDDITALPSLPDLRVVSLAQCPRVCATESLLACDQLRNIAGEDFTTHDVRALLEKFGTLRNIQIRRCHGLADVAQLGGHAALRHLEFDACGRLRSLSVLENFPSLRALVLVDCPELTLSGEDLAAAKLRRLDLSWCGGIRNLEAVRHLPALRSLRLQALRITDLEPLAGLVELQTLEVLDCEQITDLSPLAGLPALRRLSLQRTGTRLDLGALGAMERLRVVHSGNAYNAKALAASSRVTIGTNLRVPD